MLPQLPNFVSNRYTSHAMPRGSRLCDVPSSRATRIIRLTFVTYYDIKHMSPLARPHVARMARNMLCVLLRLHAARRCGAAAPRPRRARRSHTVRASYRTRDPTSTASWWHMAYRNTWRMQLSVLRLDSDTCSRTHALTRHRRSPRDRRASDDVYLSDSRLFR